MQQRLALLWLALFITSCAVRNPPMISADTGVDLPDAGWDANLPQPRDAGPPQDAGPRLDDVLIYAHSRDTLYTFSPYTNTVSEIGVFRHADGTPAGFMLDLAVDAAGAVFTSGDETLFAVDPLTAVVTVVGDFDLATERLFALSFLTPSESPDGTEMLVGATNEGVVYAVDRVTARTRRLGTYPEGWLSSGDIVSIDGLGTFATLRRSDYPGDVLARILFARDGSSTVTVVGPVRSGAEDFRQLFGLGYWGRDVFGFDNMGRLLRLDRATGATEVVTTATGATQFWGAGVTTQAPVLF
ncbi:MAG: hypothetical protein KF729_16200 [Sandaracinaceae bacterium]|nr:hypothetical protein [Sandaracinaceae bacterium]